MNNADLQYRPLLGGISLLNARVAEPGTLGYFGRDALGATWIISAYHVLCNSDLSPYVADEAIYQPAAEYAPYHVATTHAAKANVQLDCAAARLDTRATVLNAQLALGAVAVPKAAAVGMRVCKSGAVTGVTEGVITQVDGDTIQIAADIAFDANYVLSDAGDSGSLWLEQSTRAPVGLHRGHGSPRVATAGSILDVLAALQLTPLPTMV